MPRTVLLVERHDGVRTALAERLTEAPEPWVVQSVSTLKDAVTAVQEMAPAVILCDPRGLNQDHDATAVVRSLSALGVPVVVLAPTLRAGEERLLQQAGAQAVLVQGLPLAALRQRLMAAVVAGAVAADPPRRAAG